MGPEICCCNRAANQYDVPTAAAMAASVTSRYWGQSPYSASKIGADAMALSFYYSFNLPVVVVDQPMDVPGTSRVCIDDRAAMRELADYVVGLGHRDIGLLTMRLGRDRPNGSPQPAVAGADRLQTQHFHVQRERISGVRDAMAAAGLDPESLTVVESYEHLPTSGGAAAEVALDANPRITALMCTADVLALSAMDYLRARGIYVPGQMTVTGFDGVPEALRRGLTTVVQPSLDKGRRAGRLLHSPPRSGLPVIDVLDTEVVRGRTSGAPA